MSNKRQKSPRSNVKNRSNKVKYLTISQIYFSLDGRIHRSTFWLSLSGLVVAIIALAMVLISLGIPDEIISNIAILSCLPLIWCVFAIQTKRWHDRDKSGSWILISLIPVIGSIWALIENGFLAGTAGENSFGPPSK